MGWQSELQESVRSVPAHELAELIGELARFNAQAFARLAGAPATLDKQSDYRVQEVAAMYGRADSTVRNWCATGLLPGAYRVNGREWMIPPSAVQSFKGARKEKPLPSRAVTTGAADWDAWKRL